ncbi:hypothetical protein TcYC6_0118290 [Trypanosoma cruzi]|nr:hypothetical protein TcYC6_0118290 [Trypanosoma cruzi]
MCPHAVGGQAHSAAGWAGGRQSAARRSARSGGVHVGKMFRRRRRQAGLLGEKAAPPTQRVTCDLQGACGPAEERAGVASRLYGVPQLGARCRGGRQKQSPRHTEERLSCGVRVFLFLLEILPVRSPDCGEEAHLPRIEAVLREGSCHDGVSVRCHVAWDSAASWGNVERTV